MSRGIIQAAASGEPFNFNTIQVLNSARLGGAGYGGELRIFALSLQAFASLQAWQRGR